MYLFLNAVVQVRTAQKHWGKGLSKFLVGQSRELQSTLAVSTWKLFISTLEGRHEARTDREKKEHKWLSK